jgi:hypothetical protein
MWEAAGRPDRYIPRGGLPKDEDEHEAFIERCESIEFPNMSALQNVTLGKRSGVTILGLK